VDMVGDLKIICAWSLAVAHGWPKGPKVEPIRQYACASYGIWSRKTLEYMLFARSESTGLEFQYGNRIACPAIYGTGAGVDAAERQSRRRESWS
jgi:hypothetical protein